MTLTRRLAAEELGAIQPLFEAVFRHPISLNLLRWKYGGSQGESWVAETDDGELILHCGVFYRDVLLFGQKSRAAQMVDLMARPKTGGLSRADSPFAVLLRRILTRLTGPDNPMALAFGFPSARAMKLAEHVGVACSVDQFVELEFSPAHGKPGFRVRAIATLNATDLARINHLWNRMRADLAGFAVGVRDANYIQWRYLGHPDRQYTLLLIESRWLRTPIGLAVIAPGDERRELLDIVCSLQDARKVIAGAQNWLAGVAGKSLVFSLTRHFADLLESCAEHKRLTEFRIMANPFTPSDCLASLENRWWLTGGDTDYR